MDTMIRQALTALLPPQAMHYLHTHVLDPRSPVQITLRQGAKYAHQAVDAVAPMIDPYVDRVLDTMMENQGVTSLAVALVIMTAVVVVMNWIRRLVMWWTRMVFRIMFWAVMALLLALAWERGLVRTGEDVVAAATQLTGYFMALKDVWIKEYNHYESQRVGAGMDGRGPHLYRDW